MYLIIKPGIGIVAANAEQTKQINEMYNSKYKSEIKKGKHKNKINKGENK